MRRLGKGSPGQASGRGREGGPWARARDLGSRGRFTVPQALPVAGAATGGRTRQESSAAVLSAHPFLGMSLSKHGGIYFRVVLQRPGSKSPNRESRECAQRVSEEEMRVLPGPQATLQRPPAAAQPRTLSLPDPLPPPLDHVAVPRHEDAAAVVCTPAPVHPRRGSSGWARPPPARASPAGTAKSGQGGGAPRAGGAAPGERRSHFRG